MWCKQRLKSYSYIRLVLLRLCHSTRRTCPGYLSWSTRMNNHRTEKPRLAHGPQPGVGHPNWPAELWVWWYVLCADVDHAVDHVAPLWCPNLYGIHSLTPSFINSATTYNAAIFHLGQQCQVQKTAQVQPTSRLWKRIWETNPCQRNHLTGAAAVNSLKKKEMYCCRIC